MYIVYIHRTLFPFSLKTDTCCSCVREFIWCVRYLIFMYSYLILYFFASFLFRFKKFSRGVDYATKVLMKVLIR